MSTLLSGRKRHQFLFAICPVGLHLSMCGVQRTVLWAALPMPQLILYIDSVHICGQTFVLYVSTKVFLEDGYQHFSQWLE